MERTERNPLHRTLNYLSSHPSFQLLRAEGPSLERRLVLSAVASVSEI